MSVGLYVHFPFCSYLCNYCDYFKVMHLDSLEEKLFRALNTETRLVGKEISKSKTIDTIFIGGGTPSIANLNYLQNWLALVRETFEFSENVEFSIECNVDSVDVDKLAAFKELGVTRPSFGMQSFNDKLLKIITRPHDPRIGHQVTYHAHVLGFKTFNIDMLFGIPRQSGEMFTSDVAQLVDMEPPHVSLYELLIEPETPLGESIDIGEILSPDESAVAAMFCAGAGELVNSGYEHYEISSFAKPGAQCRHNLNYWQGGEFLGLGPSAHSYMNAHTFANVESVGDYIKALSENKVPRTVNEPSLLKRADETIRSGLRLKSGLDREMFRERFGIALEERVSKKDLEILLKSELLEEDGRILRTSEQGYFKADEIARRLLK